MTSRADLWAQSNGFGRRLSVPPVGRLSTLTTRRSRRCGIYLLYVGEGSVYLGRSVDVIDRLAQHRQARPDLREVRFRWCSRTEVNALERELIRSAEVSGLPLVNIEQMSVVTGGRPLDVEVPIELQQAWLADPRSINAKDTTPREEFTVAERRPFVARHHRFSTLAEAPAAVEILRTYVAGCLLLPRRTERDFWSLSCLPATNASDRLACMSVGRMETLVLGTSGGFVVVAADDLSDVARRRYRRALRPSDYAAAGEHQVLLKATSLGGLAALLDDAEVSHAAAVLSYRVMRKGRTWYSRSHSPLLADDALA